MSSNSHKRLFFGLEVHAPWKESYPKGRVIEEKNRHLTIAFLGLVSVEEFSRLLHLLENLPPNPPTHGCVGVFDHCLFLPPKHPHVAAWHMNFFGNCQLHSFREELVTWLAKNGFQADCRHEFNPHITLARAPFDLKAWKKDFEPLPFSTSTIHLYESLGFSQYASRFSFSIPAPFEELDHTGDMAFTIRGKTMADLFLHAQFALAFTFPKIIPYIGKAQSFETIEEVIKALNQIVGQTDTEIGCPFKAVSYHTVMKKEPLLNWEMIIDV